MRRRRIYGATSANATLADIFRHRGNLRGVTEIRNACHAGTCRALRAQASACGSLAFAGVPLASMVGEGIGHTQRCGGLENGFGYDGPTPGIRTNYDILEDSFGVVAARAQEVAIRY